MMWLKSIRVLSWIASLGLVGSALFIAYIVLFPVDVIKDWNLALPDKNDYYLGETVILDSTYTKTIATTNDSQSERYLECKNERGVSIRYLLNKAVANRAPAKATGTGVVVEIPRELSGLSLPTTCFFSIAISYNVYPRRAEPEYNRTRNFTLHESPTSAASPPPVTPDLTAPLPTTPIAQNEFSTAKLPDGSDVEPLPAQQPQATPNPSTQQPSIFKGLIDTVTNLIKGVI